MNKKLCIGLACIGLLGCFCTGVGAEECAVTAETNHSTLSIAIFRASSSFNFDVFAGGQMISSQGLPLAAGETVRIRATYSPENASLDFGLVNESNRFYYINTTSGSFDETIQVPANGTYKLAVRNNSRADVKVAGIVRY